VASPLENLSGPGRPLQKEPPDAKEFAGLKRSALARLTDSAKNSNSLESRFDLAYNAAHALCLAASTNSHTWSSCILAAAVAHIRSPWPVASPPNFCERGLGFWRHGSRFDPLEKLDEIQFPQVPLSARATGKSTACFQAFDPQTRARFALRMPAATRRHQSCR